MQQKETQRIACEEKTHRAKPFVKWAGGKGQLLEEIDRRLGHLLADQPCTYVEPFVGGGAVLFYVLGKYPRIQQAVINDINPRLIATYRVIKDEPLRLLAQLKELHDRYIPLDHEARTEMFMEQRKRFNASGLDSIETAAQFIFLNRTCFNGLYRENSKGAFNVPHGRYAKPVICDEQTIMADHDMQIKMAA